MKESTFYKRVLEDSLQLSFSSLCALNKSPLHFLQYCTKERKTTPAMLFGQLLHCVILQPELLTENFALQPDLNKRTKQGRADFAAFVEKAKREGKQVITFADYVKVERLKHALLKNPAARALLDKSIYFEQKFSFADQGFNFRGIRDATGFGFVADVKKCLDTSDKKLYWKIMQDLLHVQAYLYTKTLNADYFLLFIADDCSSRVVELSIDTMQRGERKLQQLLNKYKRASYLYKQFAQTGEGVNPFEQSRNFWDADGVLII